MQQTNNIHNIKLNWAGLGRPNQLGRTQPKRWWADFSPKWIGPISAQILLSSSGPEEAQKTGLGQDQPGPLTRLAGPEQVWPSTRNERGELFPPLLLHAE